MEEKGKRRRKERTASRNASPRDGKIYVMRERTREREREREIAEERERNREREGERDTFSFFFFFSCFNYFSS